MAIVGASLTVAGTGVGSATAQSVVRIVTDNVNIGAGQVAGNEFIVAQLPALSRIHDIKLFCTGITGATIDIGLYREKGKTGTLPTEFVAIDDNYFGTAVDVSTVLSGTTNFVQEASAARIIEYSRRPFSQEFANVLESRNQLFVGFKFVTVDVAATGRLGMGIYYTCA